MALERRTLLKGGAAAAVAGGPFAGFVTAPSGATRGRGRGRPGSVELVPVRDKRDGEVRLHLPRGFSYRSFHDTESPVVLDDGTELPGRHDGMGAFRGKHRNDVVLVRNHELNNPATGEGAAFGGPDTPPPYDAKAEGGTTTILVDRHGNVDKAFTSLNGTMMNCSGGIMPWGSWVTCEETVNGPDVAPDFTGASNVPLEKPHGYIFEVPAGGHSNREPITQAGRFAHEAVSYDPCQGILYLTEDNFGFASGFYRYIPEENPMHRGYLDNEGTLQMLAVKDRPNLHLEGNQVRGTTYDVVWIDIPEPDKVFPYTEGEEAPTTNNEAMVFVGDQGRKVQPDGQAAAYFSRLEGQVYDDGVVYFTSTQGGGAPEPTDENPAGFGQGHGQIWGYDTEEETLTVVYQSPGPEILDFPDNVTTSRHGTLVLCEDNDDDNYLRGLSRKGRLWDIALNRLVSSSGATRYDDEFAGSTFSTDGKTLFVNIQASRGMTFAIWGPWEKIGV